MRKEGDFINDNSESASPLTLQIPKRIVNINKQPYLSWPCGLFAHCFRDIILNVLAFIPMGLACHAVFKKRFRSMIGGAGFVAIGGLLFSFGIEWLHNLQVGRFSSLVDVASNTVGTILGVTLSRCLVPDRKNASSFGSPSVTERPIQGEN